MKESGRKEARVRIPHSEVLLQRGGVEGGFLKSQVACLRFQY